MCEDWITEKYIDDVRNAAKNNYAAIKRVRKIHKEVKVFYRGEIILGCKHCFKASKYVREIFEYPCETIKALDGDK
jgi:hypothetical protein